jgi:methyltransferase (TIGR00027 family)
MEYRGRKPAERILTDPWAAHFIQNTFARQMINHPLWIRLMSFLSDRWIPGLQEYVLTRARLVDDLTVELAAQGLEQLVILGAGFDTTIFRLQDKLHRVRVFEVDHPATQRVKIAALSQIDMPNNARFIPVDFEKDDFVERLISSGFQPDRRSLITWMGVSYYLTSEAVAKTLRQIAVLCSPGSHLVFDYAIEAVIAGAQRSRAAAAGVKHAARLGEPFLSGIDPAQAKSYLARVGFDLIKQYDWRELQCLYCPPGRAPVDFTFIAFCARQNHSGS